MASKVSTRHESELVSYLRFLRSKRLQAIKDINKTFNETIERSLGKETNFTRREVISIMQQAQDQLTNDLENELVHISHTNALLLSQYFEQADQWYLVLKSNLAILEKKDLLEAMALFESEKIIKSSTSMGQKLDPLQEKSSIKDLLQMEIERLRTENESLKKSKQPQSSTTAASGEDTRMLQQQLDQKDIEIRQLREQLDAKVMNLDAVKNLYKILDNKERFLAAFRDKLQQIDPEALENIMSKLNSTFV